MSAPRAALLLCGAAAVAAPADEPPPAAAFQVLDRQTEPGPRITPLLRHQLDLAWRSDEARCAAYQAVRTEADLRSLQADVRRKVLKLIGDLPTERSPLNPKAAGTVPMDGYRVEKLVFESLPGIYVTALLYVPDLPAGPKPAVLVACGHSPLGKAFPAYQEIAGRLARRGYVALCWDPIGQGERSQFWDAARGQSRYNLICGEHAILGNLATLAGTSLVRFMVWDGMRALDYLLTRPDVDSTRIAITGTSGGGFQSTWIGALDQRIGTIAPSCFVTALPMRMANRIFEDPDTDPEQDPPGLVSEGIDHAGLLLLAYPRPVHVAAAVKDFVPIEGARKTMREIIGLYRRFGHADRIRLAEGFHEHRYSAENQESAFEFLDRFNRVASGPGLPSVQTLQPATLRCLPSGQVLLDLGGRSLMEVIREHGRERRARGALDLSRLYHDAPYPDLKGQPISFSRAPSTIHGEIVIDRYLLRHGQGLTIPLLHIYRQDARQAQMVVDFGFAGKVGPADWGAAIAHIENRYEVVSVDLRGLGETRMRYQAISIDDPNLAKLGEEEAYSNPISGVLANYVYNSVLVGRPYFLELIEDLEIASRFAREVLGAKRVAVAGRGEAWTLGAAASAVLPGLDLLDRPKEGAFSWNDAVERMREQWPIHYLLPGGVAVSETWR